MGDEAAAAKWPQTSQQSAANGSLLARLRHFFSGNPSDQTASGLNAPRRESAARIAAKNAKKVTDEHSPYKALRVKRKQPSRAEWPEIPSEPESEVIPENLPREFQNHPIPLKRPVQKSVDPVKPLTLTAPEASMVGAASPSCSVLPVEDEAEYKYDVSEQAAEDPAAQPLDNYHYASATSSPRSAYSSPDNFDDFDDSSPPPEANNPSVSPLAQVSPSVAPTESVFQSAASTGVALKPADLQTKAEKASADRLRREWQDSVVKSLPQAQQPSFAIQAQHLDETSLKVTTENQSVVTARSMSPSNQPDSPTTQVTVTLAPSVPLTADQKIHLAAKMARVAFFNRMTEDDIDALQFSQLKFESSNQAPDNQQFIEQLKKEIEAYLMHRQAHKQQTPSVNKVPEPAAQEFDVSITTPPAPAMQAAASMLPINPAVLASNTSPMHANPAAARQ